MKSLSCFIGLSVIVIATAGCGIFKDQKRSQPLKTIDSIRP